MYSEIHFAFSILHIWTPPFFSAIIQRSKSGRPTRSMYWSSSRVPTSLSPCPAIFVCVCVPGSYLRALETLLRITLLVLALHARHLQLPTRPVGEVPLTADPQVDSDEFSGEFPDSLTDKPSGAFLVQPTDANNFF